MQVVTCRTGRSALLDRATFAIYLIYVAVQLYGIVWHNVMSDRVTKLNAALFSLPYVGALVFELYWEAHPGIPQVLNIITKRTVIPEGKSSM